MEYIIRPLTAKDAAALRRIRLESLKQFPKNYTGTYEQESNYDEAHYVGWIEGSIIYGVWDQSAAEPHLIGTASLTQDPRPRNEHKAHLRMVYMMPDYQGKGLSKQLMQALLTAVRGQFEQIILAVDGENAPAIALYEGCGFTIYGREPNAAKLIDGTYRDDILMIAFLDGQ